MENQAPTPRYGGVSSRTGSPAPISKFQPLATSAPSSSALSSIMRPIRTHVRIMGYPSAFSHDGSSKRLTVKNLSKNKSQTPPPTPTPYNNAVAEDDTPAVSNDLNNNDNNSAVVYRVHEYGETIEKFFEEVVAPGIEASLSGQSVTYLLAGPPNSGKSQTMYGDNKNIKGLVGLAAEKLLHAMNVNPKVLTTFGNFMTVGDHIQDLSKTFGYSPEVPIKDYPAPIGKMALPGTSVLQDAKTCVQMSRDRNAQSTTFAQFHVYKDISPNQQQDGGSSSSTPMDSLGGPSAPKKGTFATVTFVDLAAFCDAESSPYEGKFISNKDAYEQYVQGHYGDVYSTSPELRTYPKDLIHFHRVVDSLNAGNDGDFSRTILTSLAQQFLVGPSTLVAIGTLTGVDTLHPKTMATLRFLEKLSKIHQLQALITTVQPAWLEKSVADINHRLSQREEILAVARERAMAEAYTSFRSALGKVVGGYDRFNGVLDTTATVRVAVATDQENLHAELSSLIEQKRTRLEGMESNWKNTQSTNSHETEELKRIYAEIDACAAKTQTVDKDTVAYISACKDRLADLSKFEDKFTKLERNRNGLQDNITSAVTRLHEVDAECTLVMKGLCYIGEYQQNLSNKLEAELDLQDASARAAGQPVDSSDNTRNRRNNRTNNAGDDELAVATADFVELAAEIEELCGTSCMSILSSKGIRVTPDMEHALSSAGIQTKASPKPPMFHTSGTGSVPRRPSTSTGAVRTGRYADPTISSSPQAHPQQGSTFRNSTSFSPGNKVRSAAASFVRTVSNLKGSLFSSSTVPGSRTSSISPPPMTPPRTTDRYSAGGPSFSGTRVASNGPRSRANTAPSPSVAIRSVRTAPSHAAEEEEDDVHTNTHHHDDDQPSIDMMFTGGGGGAAEYESEIIMVGGLTTRNSHLPLGGVSGRKRSRTDTTDESARSCRSEDDDDEYGSVESDEEESAEDSDDEEEEESTPSPKARRRKAAAKRASTASSSARSSKASTRKSAPATKGSKKKAPAKKASASKSTSRSATPVAPIRSRAKAPSRAKSTSVPKASKSKSARR